MSASPHDKSIRPSPYSEQHVFSSLPSDPDITLDSVRSNFHARGFVAFGDSYSAGIGTGTDDNILPSEGDCRRGQHAYPLLLHNDLDNRTRTNTSLQWLSCTGARTASLLPDPNPSTHSQPTQLEALNTSLPTDFATLSIGGNDIGFFDVMNACIFRFYAFRSGSCPAALAQAETTIRSGVLRAHIVLILLSILDRARWERHPTFSITVTGYARFFGPQLDRACDAASLSVWRGPGAPRLTREVRGAVNELVLAANEELELAVRDVAGRFGGDRPRVVFAGYDGMFEGHRLCEAGVVEPDVGRVETWFFLPGGPDNARGETTWPNGTNGDDGGGEEPGKDRGSGRGMEMLLEPEACVAGARRRGDWGELALCYMAAAKARDPSLRLAVEDGELGDGMKQSSMWWVPTYYGKTFHPRSLGCEGIRDSIYETWRKYGL